MSTVQEIKAAIAALPDPDFRELSQAVDEMEAERFDRAVESAAHSGKLKKWLDKVDADIDAGRVKPLDEIKPDTKRRWPRNFFKKIRITDRSFQRLDQGRL